MFHVVVEREKSVVTVLPYIDLLGEAAPWAVRFQSQRNSLLDAALLHQAIQKQMEKALASIREKAYAAGWSDAKARRRKITDFHSCWDPNWVA